MLSQIRIIVSDSYDPVFNLALEATLLEEADPEMMLMFLWQNEKTIVIGRHQNPYKECNLTKVREDQVKIIRRRSGGGAVYHDLGNLNFTFIAGEAIYDVQRQSEVIIKAINAYGLHGEMSGRNDLTIEGTKFSGHAYMSHESNFCHHGTLLVKADIEKLASYLTVSELKIQSKGVDSVRARVVNLSDLTPLISIDNLKDTLIKTFKSEYGYDAKVEHVSPDAIKDIINHKVNENMMTFERWDWNFLESPNFIIEHSKRFDWGIFEIQFDNDNGRIKHCIINSDSLSGDDFSALQMNLINNKYEPGILKQAIRETLQDEKIVLDLCTWLDEIM